MVYVEQDEIMTTEISCECKLIDENLVSITLSTETVDPDERTSESILEALFSISSVQKVSLANVPGTTSGMDQTELSTYRINISLFDFTRLAQLTGVAYFNLPAPFGPVRSDQNIVIRFTCDSQE